MRGAFACSAGLAGCRVLLIDDVLTTGASLDELARVMKEAGAQLVEVTVIARAVRD